MNLNQIYRLGYYAAIMGCSTIDDCPYKGHKQQKQKRAWILGYIEGLRTIWGTYLQNNGVMLELVDNTALDSVA